MRPNIDPSMDSNIDPNMGPNINPSMKANIAPSMGSSIGPDEEQVKALAGGGGRAGRRGDGPVHSS